MFQCREVSRKLSQSMDTRLPLHHRMAIRVHLLMCRYCSLFYRQMRLLRHAGRLDDVMDLPPEAPNNLSKEARDRIKASLDAQLKG
jgi:hypothetical protein